MDRTPPATVKYQLREEVGFGCPVPGCRSPFLTWHHFDPKWSEHNHHNPEGMIALCDPHHKFADSGGWSKAELRQFKSAENTVDSVRGKLPWSRSSMLLRIGSTYMSESTGLLKVFGRPMFGLTRSKNGLLNLNYEVRDEKGQLLAKIVDNVIETGPVVPHDLSVSSSATKIVVRSAPKKPVLSLRFRRIEMPTLRELLFDDFKKTKRHDAKFLQLMKEYGCDFIEPTSLDIEREFEESSVTKQVDAFARDTCLDDEGFVSLVDVLRVRMTYRRQVIDIGSRLKINGVEVTYGCNFEKGSPFELWPNSADIAAEVCADRASSIIFPYTRRRSSFRPGAM